MQRTNISASPYFDDYDTDKNFHRVLFRPRPVQARELNQVQSILMDQISRMGSHLFTEGSMVIPGGIKIIQDQDYVTLDFAGSSVYSDILNRDNLVIKSSITQLSAKIAKIIPVEGSDKVTLFVDYTNSGSGQEKVFANNSSCTITSMVNGVEQPIANVVIGRSGTGSWAKVIKGVWFVRGMFVQTEDQDVVISKYAVDATSKVGFRIAESIVDESTDPSLLSNAIGQPNFLSPGATRLKVTLTLVSAPTNYTDTDFIELARVESGVIQTKIDTTNYNVIQKAIAQRSYETNGDYTVEPFGIEIKEHLKVGNNGGVYGVADGGSETKLVAAIKPGIGYVKGYRVQNLSMVNVPVDKARDTVLLNNGVISADYGPYVIVTNLKSVPDMDIKKKILILGASSAVIGYCRIRAMRRETATTYRMYIFDVVMNADRSFGQSASLKYSSSDSLFTCDLVSPVQYGSTTNALIFKLPVNVIKSLTNAGISDTTYSVMRGFNTTTNGTGTATIGVSSVESFGSIDDLTCFIALNGPTNVGTSFPASSVATLTGNPAGSSITVNLGASYANTSIRIVAPVIKLSTTQKTKTLSTITDELLVFANVTSMNLSKSDIRRVTMIKDAVSGEDITSLFALDNGQRNSWYQVGAISVSSGTRMTRNVKVTYTYYEHSAGDYFSVDSYGGLSRDEIGNYSDVPLSDCIDFRPRKDAAGDMTVSTISGEIVRPNDTIRADITYYLPRRDVVYVNADGVFAAVKGVPSLSPISPEVPTDGMKLFDLFIPAYTSNPNGVLLSIVDNRRYTMRDIGKLETRIKNVEYYTTLSALEAKTNSIQIFDPVTGNNRFKNGFAVDGFNDFVLADVASPGWAASIDTDAGELKPQFMENGSDLYATGSISAGCRTKVYMKTYGEVMAVTQPYATKTCNINPYAVFTWIGSIELTPSTDFWKDVKYLAPVIINNTNDLRNGAVQGTIWSTWGGFTTVASQTVQTTQRNGGNASRATGMLGRLFESFETPVNITTTTATTTTNSTLVTTSFDEFTTTSSSDNFVGNSIIPFMRSIEIKVRCERYKPFTRLYAFWDGTEINTDCALTPGGSKSAVLVTDASGACTFYYTVPNRDDKRFRTGTSSLRVTDSAVNSVYVGEFSSMGETTFVSGGSVDERQVFVTNTRNLTAATSSTTFTSTTSAVISTRTEAVDPIAQTFRVPVTGGSFITKVDIFFASKARDIPVTLELRTVSTGMPTSDVFARKVLYPASVNVSADASIATTFVFDDAVYVDDNTEYAIVLMADTQEYNVYISELGENVIGQNMAVAKQPSLGVFFTSSNSTTWNPNQLQDLKFNIHRAVFNSSVDGVVTFSARDPIALPMDFNAGSTTNGSNLVSYHMKSHGLKPGDVCVITGLISGNNIDASSVNGLYKTVLSSDIDNFVIGASTSANQTGSFGGANMMAKANYPFSVFLANIEAVNFSRTDTLWEYRYVDQATRVFTGWTPFSPKKTFELAREGVLRSGSDFQVRATMKSQGDSLSPVINTEAFTAVLVSPRINNDFANPVYAYETQAIQFDNPSTSATFYIGATLPTGTDMRMYYKTFDGADTDLNKKAWVQLTPNKPISNDLSPIEYTYELKNAGTFVGYKIRIVLVGTDPASYPTLTDFRSIALA